MTRSLCVLAFVAAASSFAGCKGPAEARYVLRSPEMGVIAMPADTPENRERAFALMHSHFPEGYEIVAEGEEAVLAPLPSRPMPMAGPSNLSRGPTYDPVAAAGWNEPAFQREVESLPGTPQSMQGYSQPPAPSVGIHVGDRPARPAGVVRSEWRMTYRRKGVNGNAGPHSLFPESQESQRSMD